MRGRLLSAAEMATDEIRELIESGSLRPGERINAGDLADQLQVSRTPIRDALQVLRNEGLVEILPRKGVFVRRTPKQEVDEVYSIKAAIEPLAAAWAAERGTAEAKQQLATLIDDFRAAAEEHDVLTSARRVDDLHLLLFSMADSKVLSDVYRVLHGRVKLLRHLNMAQPGRLEVSLQEHTEIVRLVVAGDATKASKAMARHMTGAAAAVRHIVDDDA